MYMHVQCIYFHAFTSTEVPLCEISFFPLGPSHSPLAAYETGPLLAVFPSVQSNSRGMSCDAQFLWKPEAINSGPFLHKSVCEIHSFVKNVLFYNFFSCQVVMESCA